MIRLGNALIGVKAVCAPFIIGGIEPEIEPLVSAGILMNNTPKPGWVGTYSAKQLKYLGMLARIAVDGDEERLKAAPPIVVNVMCMTAPLKIDNRSCSVLEAALEAGYPINFASMPIMGATAPITPAGSAVVAAAETLGGIVAASLINPDAFYYSTSITSEMDMKTTAIRFATPGAMLTDALVHQLFRYKYGIVHNVEPAYIDARLPGIQAAYLKMFRLMAQAGTVSLPLPLGLLDNGSMFSPVQAMLDYDINGAIYRFMKGCAIDESTLAADVIGGIAFADETTYMEHGHTLEHFRGNIWEPDIFDTSFGDAGASPEAEDKKLLARAEERWRALVQSAPEFEPEAGKRKEIDAVVSAGIKDMLGE
jgi:trimethylamine--corrinoid protein Co-methyltransferase